MAKVKKLSNEDAGINFSGTLREARNLESNFSALLKVRNHGFTFEATVNANKLRKAINEWNEAFLEAQKSLYLKDEKGEPINFVAKNGVLLKDENDEPIKQTPGMELKDGEVFVNKFDPDREDEKKEMFEKFNNKKIELSLEPISREILVKKLKSGVLDGNDFTDLLDFAS